MHFTEFYRLSVDFLRHKCNCLLLQGTNNGTKGKADPGEKKDGTKWVIIVATTAGISGILILSYYIWKGRTRTQGKILKYSDAITPTELVMELFGGTSDAHSHETCNGVMLWIILITI